MLTNMILTKTNDYQYGFLKKIKQNLVENFVIPYVYFNLFV